MVSLIERGMYLNQFGENPKVLAFLGFLFPGNGDMKNQEDSVIDVDTTFLSLINSIMMEDKTSFMDEYKRISQRTPNSQTPFVNDDYLLFIIAIGVDKFKVNPTWFESVLEVRKCVTEECLIITKTFQNIVCKNYNSLDNNFSIVTVAQSFLGTSLISNNNKKVCYSSIVSKRFPKYDSAFLNILDLKAYDILIEEQLLNESSDLFLLKAREEFAQKRIVQIANGTYIFLYIFWVGLVYYIYYTFPVFQNFIQSSESIFGFLGFGGILALIFEKEVLIGFICAKISKLIFG